MVEKGNALQQEQIEGNLEWDGLHRPRIFYAMAAIFMGLFLSVLDGSICNVALPGIARELQVSSSDSIWVVNSFQLMVMMFLLPFSVLGELKGFKRIYLYGMIVFTVGSLCCALSHDLLQLVLSRMLQGFGAAMIMSVNGSLVRLIYPRRHMAKGFGLNATVVAAAAVAGPTLAAAILSVASWPWLFAVNVPIGIVTYFMGRKYLPQNPTRIVGRRFDWHSAVLNVLTFGLLIGSLEAYSHGASLSWVFIGLFLLLFFGIWYVRLQLRQRYPMLPFDLLRIPVFSLSVLTSVLSFTAQMLAMVSLPFMFHTTFGYDSVATGLLLTSWPVVIMIAAPLAGVLTSYIHPGALGAVGLTVMSVGCFLLSFVPADAGHARLVLYLCICGFGFGLFQTPNNHLLLTSAPSYRSGGASGMQATARLVGQTTGAALVALLFHLFGPGAPHDALLLAGVLTLCGALSSFGRTKTKVK